MVFTWLVLQLVKPTQSYNARRPLTAVGPACLPDGNKSPGLLDLYSG